MKAEAQGNEMSNTAGIYPRHLHLETGTELSGTGEDKIKVIRQTTLGGFGNRHENVWVGVGGRLSAGHASLMEGDCQNWYVQGDLTIHNLHMEKDALFRVSIGRQNKAADGTKYTRTDCLNIDSDFLFDKVNIDVLFEELDVDEGCYPIVRYSDLDGLTGEYVKNFVLVNTRFGHQYLSLDFFEEGVVKLCVSDVAMPLIQRFIVISDGTRMGITTHPGVGKSYVTSSNDFTFQATGSGCTP